MFCVFISECTGDDMQCNHIGNSLTECLVGYGCSKCNDNNDCSTATLSYCDTTTNPIISTTGTCAGNIIHFIYTSKINEV